MDVLADLIDQRALVVLAGGTICVIYLYDSPQWIVVAGRFEIQSMCSPTASQKPESIYPASVVKCWVASGSAKRNVPLASLDASVFSVIS
jgi:hypothetical protein